MSKSTRICVNVKCGKEFVSNHPIKKYCSKSCRRVVTNKRYAKTEGARLAKQKHENLVRAKLARQKYATTAKGRVARQKAMEKYIKTAKGRAAVLQVSYNYKKNNPTKIVERRRKAHSRRYDTDPQYKLQLTLRVRMRHALKANFAGKAYNTNKLLGCSFKDLKSYLENRWQLGMSWDNYSGIGDGFWVIDHIKPCCQFDLTDEEQQRKCFHFTNLQPLWYNENMEKSKLDKAGM